MAGTKKPRAHGATHFRDDQYATETPATEGEKLRADVEDAFRELQLAGEDPAAPFLRGAPRRKDYRPLRFRGATGGSKEWRVDQVAALYGDAPVPEELRFMAERLVDVLGELARGTGRVPRLVPDERDRVQGAIGMHRAIADGERRWFPSDRRRIDAAFRAVFGVRPARYWEVVLERALRDAIAMRALLPEQPGAFEVHGVVVEVPRRPTAADVLAVVHARALPGSVPGFLTVKLLEVAFEQCTDADRGGGRGPAKKVSVRSWIRNLNRTIAGRGRETRTRKRP